MFNPERRRRAVHKLAVTAAALAVCVLPTACDYPVLASPTGAPTAPVGGSAGTETTDPVVVPVGNTSDANAPLNGDRDRDGDRRRPPKPSGTSTSTPQATGTSKTTPPTSTIPTNNAPVGGTSSTTTSASATAAPPTTISKKELLGRTCFEGSNRRLERHTGFQAESPPGTKSNRAQCVTTQMGAVAADGELPSLLITNAPPTVAPGAAFTLTVSTRNLVRDRFLGAAAGGYYLEASFLDDQGLQRGHFHTACRLLPNPDVAPLVERSPFFLATQDGGGGTEPDPVTIAVPGSLTEGKSGALQCASWAGDGSHRTPMMSFANQIPAFDSVRINIGGNAPALPDAPAAGAQADAQADAQQQVEGQQQEAGQAPDQDGSGEPAGEANAPAAPAPAESPAPAADESAAPASSSASAAPAANQSLNERFRQLRESREAGEG